jgi:ornithine carbamoyltransferase
VHRLGGTVALLDANDRLSSAFERVPDAARMLGRLYNAIDCCDLPTPLVEQIDAHSGVPVFNGVARPEHPLRQLVVDAMAVHGALRAVPSEEEPLLALQALIVCGMP